MFSSAFSGYMVNILFQKKNNLNELFSTTLYYTQFFLTNFNSIFVLICCNRKNFKSYSELKLLILD